MLDLDEFNECLTECLAEHVAPDAPFWLIHEYDLRMNPSEVCRKDVGRALCVRGLSRAARGETRESDRLRLYRLFRGIGWRVDIDWYAHPELSRCVYEAVVAAFMGLDGSEEEDNGPQRRAPTRTVTLGRA